MPTIKAFGHGHTFLPMFFQSLILLQRDTMPYLISFDESLEIVHVIYAGIISLQERFQAVEEVCGSYSELVPLKIIVNVRELKMQLTFEEQQTFGEYLANHPGLANARVAVLHNRDSNPNIVVDSTAFQFGYTLAQFSHLKDAEDWLLGK